MKKKWKIVTAAGILLLTCGFYTWGIPAVVNIKAHKNFVESKIYENSGYIVDIGNPEISMGMFPSVWIKTDNFSILNKDNSKALSIDNPRFKVKIFPLLFKKVEIAKVSATKEDIYFVLSKEGKFLLGEYPLKANAKQDFTLEKMDLNLGAYNVLLDDKLNGQKLTINGEYFEHGKYVQNKHLKFGTKGVLKVQDKATDYFADVEINLPINQFSEDKLKMNAKIEDFDIASIAEYVRILSKGQFKDLNGTVNFSARTEDDSFGHKRVIAEVATKNLEILGKDKAASIIYKDDLTAKINFTTVENGINFKNSTIASKNIYASVDGSIYKLGQKYPYLDLNVTAKASRLDDICAILPGTETLIPEFNLYKLKKYVFYGRGEGKIKFKGVANRPFVTGFVKIRDGYLIHPIKGAPANANIDLNFVGKKMNLDVYVPTSKDQSVSVKGMVLIDGSKYSELQIESTDSVSLAPAQEVLNPLHEILKFQLGPVPILKVAGLGGIKLRSAGKKVDPHIWGEIHFRNVTASFNDIHNLVLKNGSGEVVFNDTQTTFKSYHATINGKPVEIKGDCSVLGKLNVFVTAKGQSIQPLIKVINTSPILVDIQKVVAPFTNPRGVADVFLNIYGNAKNAETIEFNKDLFAKGTITLHNATTVMQDTYLPFTRVNGVVNFNQYDSDYDINGYVRNSKIFVKGTGSNSQIDLTAKSDKFAMGDCTDLLYPKMNLPYQKEAGRIDVAFTGHYKGIAEAGKLDYNNVLVDGKFLSNKSSSNPIKINGGTFTIRKGVLKTSQLSGLFNNNPYTLSLTLTDIYNKMNIADAVFNFKNFDVSVLNVVKTQMKLPKELEQQMALISDIRGKTNINGHIHNGKIWANTNLANISFVYKPYNTLVRILNGQAKVRGNELYLERVNTKVSSMPVFIDGSVSDIYTNPNLHLFVSAKPTQMFFDRFLNSKSVYPVKLKGDVNFNAHLRGALNRLGIRSNLNIGENSSIYYMGATLAGAPTGTISSEGMTTNPVSVISDVVLYPDKVRLNYLRYNQTITSQNKRASVQNQLNASGEVALLKDNVLGFKNLKITTNQPTNAKIFNILLKKPTIKQGVFTSDVTINGTSLAPKILGNLNVTSVDIPLLDATIRDISVDFKNDFIYLKSKGVVLTNDIIMFAKILNKTEPPYVIDDVNVQMDVLDLNVISNALNDFDADYTRTNHIKANGSMPVTPEQFIIKHAEVNADKILIKKANATNFKSDISLGADHIFNINKYRFNLANGTVDGRLSYNLSSQDGYGEMHIKNADASIIGENFFDMPGQMYGLVTGEMSVACKGISSVDCINTLSGNGNFTVANGRMPKLGSLEYLLKAGNLITGGITGLSINGIIDLITPLKTGNFQSISGSIKVKNGIANDIQVFSKGKDLNMYLTGSYNIATLVADMEVYGSLSKNFSTLLGRIGNASLNRLFSAIPGISINEINPKSTSNINKIPNFDKNNTLRVFKAEIYGDINGNNYVKSFRWIKD